jgi:hypothetical protein
MENQLQKIQSIDDVVRMGKVFAESKMFKDVHTVAQAIVKVQAGSELGIPPFQAISGVHIISGKAVIGAGLMASMVDRHPEYDFEVLEQTDKVCEIKFYKNGKVRGTSRFTAEDARKAGTQNMTKYAANMLYARAMSNGVKWYAPGVFAGPVYVPEEMQQEETQEATYIEVKESDNKPHHEPQAIKPIQDTTQEANAVQATIDEPLKHELIRLLNHPKILRQEKTKMLLNINRMDDARLQAAIDKIQAAIDNRENEPVEQVVYRNLEETA